MLDTPIVLGVISVVENLVLVIAVNGVGVILVLEANRVFVLEAVLLILAKLVSELAEGELTRLSEVGVIVLLVAIERVLVWSVLEA